MKYGRFNTLVGMLVCAAVLLIAAAVLPSAVCAHDSMAKGRKMLRGNLVSPGSARAVLTGRILPPVHGFYFSTPPEFTSLARGLKNDPDLIFQYVYETIRYEIGYGAQKGALGCFLDQSGNAFDQALLLKALLQAAGHSATLAHGSITVTGEQFASWIGVNGTLTDQAAARILAYAGVPARVNGTVIDLSTADPQNAQPLSSVEMDHVWVKTTGGEGASEYDPSFKHHQIVAGIDLADAMGYSRNDLITTTGGTIHIAITNDPNDYSHAQGLNRTAVRGLLAQYTGALKTEILTSYPDSDLRSIVGGVKIDAPVTPDSLVETEEWTGGIPDAYQTLLRIKNGGMEVWVRAADVYGRRLTMMSDGSTSTLRLDGMVAATGSTAVVLEMEINHPFAATDDSGVPGTYGDQYGKVLYVDGGEALIVTQFGNMGLRQMEYHRQLLKQYRASGQADDSEPVTGQTLGQISRAFGIQAAMSRDLMEKLSGVRITNLHDLGVVMRNPSYGIGLVMDLALCRSAVAALNLDNGKEVASFVAYADLGSSLESTALAQVQPVAAMSASNMIDRSALNGRKLFEDKILNWSALSTDLDLANQAPLLYETLDDILNGPTDYHIFAPDGELPTMGSWQSQGFILVPEDETTGESDFTNILHLINGRKGAICYNTSNTTCDPNAAAAEGPFEDQSQCPVNTVGQPIDMANGRFYHDYEDLTVGSNGLNRLEFGKSYYSSTRWDDFGLGYGWRHNHATRLLHYSDGFASLGKTGARETVSAVAALYAAQDVLRTSPITVDKIYLTSMIVTWFTEQLINNVAAITFPGGSKLFVKNPDGTFGNGSCCGADQLTQNPDGSYLFTTSGGTQYDFDGEGRLVQKTDPNGNTLTYTYSNDHLIEIFSSFGRWLTLAWTDDHISQVSDGSRTVQYDYDASGRLITSRDAEGHVTTFEYDAQNRLTKIYNPTNAATPFVENTYDGASLIKTQKVAGGPAHTYYIGERRSEAVDPLGNAKVWEFQTDRLYGQPMRAVKITNESGRTTTYDYDGLWRMIREIRPEGNGVGYTYDGKNNPLTIAAYDKTGNNPLTTTITYNTTYNKPASVTDPLNRTVSFGYDGNGNLQTITRPSVSGGTPVTTFTYTNKGLPATRTDPDGMVTGFGYNSVGDLVSATLNDGGLNLTTLFGYDAAGNVASITDPRGNTAGFTYDDQRQITQSTAPSPFNYITHFGYDADGHLTSVTRQGTITETISATYSLTGNILTETSPGGHTTQYQYDDLDRLWKITDPENRVTQYGYDPAGRLTVEINGNGHNEAQYGYTDNGHRAWIKDADNNTTSYTYDGYDRLVRTTYPNGTYEELTLDNCDRIQSMQTRDNRSITFGYDNLDRITSRSVPGGSTDTYAYDLANRIIDAVTSGLGTFHQVYDTAGRLTSVTDPNNRTVTYQYDAASNRTRLAYPDGSNALYAYDELGRMTTVQYDPNDSSTPPAPTTVATYTYDNLSRRNGATLGNGTSATLSYSPNSLLSGITHTTPGGNVAFTYEHDTSGLITSLSVSDNMFAPFTDIGGYKSFTPNNLNQYTAAMGNTITHDQNGNLASDGTNSYVHDAANHLTTATVSSTTWTYAYGPLGRRVSKTDGTATTRYLYDNARAVAEYNGSGALLRKFIYGPGLDEPIIMIAPGDPNETVYYYHADHLGSVIGLTNSAGAWAEKYAYTLYGKPAASSTAGNPYMYTGRRFDAETGLYYYRARYYNTNLRRFLQPDPIGYMGGLNLYAYVQNNSINFNDPHGESAIAVAAPIAGYAALIDGPLPFGEAIGAVILAGAGIYDLYLLSEGWMSPEEAARQRANDILKDKKADGCRSQGDRSGRSGDPYNAAASELKELAKDKNLLPQYRDELLKKSKEFLDRAKELNHPGRR